MFGIEVLNPVTDQFYAPLSLDDFKISDIDESTSTAYYGFLDKDGNWYIMQVTATAVRYKSGTSAYTTNWTGRVDLVYGYFDVVF